MRIITLTKEMASRLGVPEYEGITVVVQTTHKLYINKDYIGSFSEESFKRMLKESNQDDN